MKEAGELGWLRLTDKSNLVLTSLHVLQHQDRGIFGESQAIIPRKAITSVRLSWRSRGLNFSGDDSAGYWHDSHDWLNHRRSRMG